MYTLPSFHKMMDLIESEGISGMTETIKKRSKVRTLRAQGLDVPNPVDDILADHVIAYNQYGHDDGTYHPEYVSVPKTADNALPWMHYIENNGTRDAIIRRIPMVTAVMLNLSRRNSGRIYGSNGFIDKRAFEEEDLPIPPEKLRGFSAKIKSDSHRVFNSPQDWIKFVNEHGVDWTDDNGISWKLPDWQSHVDNGVYSVEWNRAFFDDLEDNEKVKELWDAKVGGLPKHMMAEPQIGILHKDAIRSTEPYKWKNTADKTSSGYADYKNGTYMDQASREVRNKRAKERKNKGSSGTDKGAVEKQTGDE